MNYRRIRAAVLAVLACVLVIGIEPAPAHTPKSDADQIALFEDCFDYELIAEMLATHK